MNLSFGLHIGCQKVSSTPPPQPTIMMKEITLYLSKIKALIFFQHVQLGLISLIFLCSDIAYVLKQKPQRKRNKQSERNNYIKGNLQAELLNTKSRIDFLADFFLFFPFCFCFSFSPFFSLFLFLSPFLSFLLAEYWGRPSRPCRPVCYAPVY